MNEQQAQDRIAQLRREIDFHENLYRVQDAPQISDDDFDLLMRELRTLEDQYPQFRTPDSPTQKVGDDLSSAFVFVPHLSPMQSLDNVFDSSELDDFDARLKKVLNTESDLKYCVEPKIDGAGISAVYENGILVRLLTRGNGEKGNDITRNAFAVKNLPARLRGKNVPSLLEIRGECYMERAEFDRISAEQRQEFIEKALAKKVKDSLKNSGESAASANAKLSPEELSAIEKKLPANPRNLAAGTMKLLDRSILRNRSLKAVFYSIGTLEGAEIKRQADLPPTLESWGLPAVNWYALADGSKGAFEKICELEGIRADFPFNTDGAVVKLDDCSLHDAAGMTSHAPRWAIAWKYRAQRAETRLNSITIQVGRTGAITPVAELEPIPDLSGTEVRRATLHNEGYISSKDIREGDTVIVEKAGEIIPAVLGVNLEKRPADSKPFEFPTICPECGSPLKKFGEKMLSRCPNFSCPPQVRGRLEHFGSRGAMDIQGLGEKVVAALVEKLGVGDPSDLYRLTRDDLFKIDGFKDKSVDNLLASIAESKKRELWRLVYGLGILEIGSQFAKDLSAKFGSLDAIVSADIEDIKSIEGFGSKSPKKKKDGAEREQPVRALSVRAFFDDPHNRELVEKLRSAGLNFKAVNAAVSYETPFTGKTFVITGTLESMGRDKAKEVVEKFGGRVASSVSAKTFAVVYDGKIEGEKIRRARELGVKIILEPEFLEMTRTAESGESEQTSASEEPDAKKPDSPQMTFGF